MTNSYKENVNVCKGHTYWKTIAFKRRPLQKKEIPKDKGCKVQSPRVYPKGKIIQNMKIIWKSYAMKYENNMQAARNVKIIWNKCEHPVHTLGGGHFAPTPQCLHSYFTFVSYDFHMCCCLHIMFIFPCILFSYLFHIIFIFWIILPLRVDSRGRTFQLKS